MQCEVLKIVSCHGTSSYLIFRLSMGTCLHWNYCTTSLETSLLASECFCATHCHSPYYRDFCCYLPRCFYTPCHRFNYFWLRRARMRVTSLCLVFLQATRAEIVFIALMRSMQNPKRNQMHTHSTRKIDHRVESGFFGYFLFFIKWQNRHCHNLLSLLMLLDMKMLKPVSTTVFSLHCMRPCVHNAQKTSVASLK